MGIKVDGDFNALIVGLTQEGQRVMKNASRRMAQEAERIRTLAIDYAPVDTHGIEESIKIERYQAPAFGSRVEFYVYVDGGHIAADGTPVGEYAYYQHEGLVRMKGGGWGYNWHPGPATLEKMASLGVFCGPKFLERAADERESEIEESIFNAIKDS
ncbi:hypothetical protein [Chromobacterium phragmitis]|uniref:HK97 gp10 family phage protein n=1 Tax=Chromobacterium phragmitis TaxID=2202141 RepID=A0ABV0J2A0_9NEIS